MFVVTNDFVRGAIIQNRKSLDPLNDLLDVAMEFFLVVAPRLFAFALDLPAQHRRHRFGDALPASTRQFSQDILAPPSSEHWLGTDSNGADVLSGFIIGSRVSIAVGFAAALVYSLPGQV